LFTGGFVLQINPNNLDNPSDAEVNGRHLIGLLNEVVSAIIQAIDAYPECVMDVYRELN
jgi:hypothetical protein